MTNLNAGRTDRSNSGDISKNALPVLRRLLFQNEEFGRDGAGEFSACLDDIGERLYIHAFTFDVEGINHEDDYAELFRGLVQHAGLVQHDMLVTSNRDQETGIASIVCETPDLVFSAKWKQPTRRVEDAFLDFANATLNAIGGRKHVRLPPQEQRAALICVPSDDFDALDELIEGMRQERTEPRALLAG
jgi:hypothetical protein